MVKKIGFFGGTFDPIHFGHLNLALEILEKKPLDEIWFCPTKKNPLKQEIKTASILHRKQMINLAIQSIPQFKVVNEKETTAQSAYTIDTLRYLIEQEKKRERKEDKVALTQLFLIIGEDILSEFLSWKEPEEIIKLAPLIIGCRHLPQVASEKIKLSEIKLNPVTLSGKDNVLQAMIAGKIKTQLLDISATEIRQRLAQGLYCKHLIPQEVIDYIQLHHLYLTRSK